MKSLGEVIEFAYGKALKASQRVPGNIPVFGSNGIVGSHNEALVSGPGIIVGRKGNPGIVKWSSRDFYPIDTTFYIIPKDPLVSLYYLFYALLEHDLPSLSADSAVPGLNRNIAYMNDILIPPQNVLKVFNDKNAPIYRMIDSNEDYSVLLSSLRDTLLPQLISGELRLPAEEIGKFAAQAGVPDVEAFLKEAGI